MIKKGVIIALFIMLVLSGAAGCGSSSHAAMSGASAGPAKMADGQGNSGFSNNVANKPAQVVPTTSTAPGATNADGTSPGAVTQANPAGGHKIIQTGNISIESQSFDKSVSQILEYVASIGGYAESSNIQGQGIENGDTERKRTANFVFRVPSDKYTDFFTKMKGYGVVTLEQSQGQDISDQYFDTEARVKSLKIQEERELALLQKADKLADVLELEKELNNVRYQIDSYTGTLKKWDSLISYSTIRVDISEVDEYVMVPAKKQGLGARISYTFANSMKQLIIVSQDFIVILVALLPFLVVLGIILALVWFIRKKLKKLKEWKIELDERKKDDN